MGIFPSCSHMNTTIWQHHLDCNKMPGEKVTWELHKDAPCCFEQIMEISLYKTVAVCYLASKTSKACWVLLEK